MTTEAPIDLLDLIGQKTTLKKAANIEGRGPEYEGACPFCGGKDRLRVQPDKGQWWCRQCSPSEHWQSAADYVMQRDGVDFKEAMRRLGQGPPEPDTWDYHDAGGELIYQVVRFKKSGEKSYAQRTPTTSGDWQWGLKGVQPVIYRLPEVLRAADMGETIYITEGEKCADALRRLGFVATTNSGGAGKWRPQYSAYLDGAGDAIILADNDDAGWKHAQEVLRHTKKIVSSARIVTFDELPTGADVADWLALGHTKEDLLERCATTAVVRVEDAPPAKVVKPISPLTPPIDFYDLLAMPREPIRWYAPGLLREGLGVLAGEANVGKTPLVVQLAIAIASGGVWMNKVQCRQGRVLFIGTEYTRGELAYVIESSSAGVRPPAGMLTFKCLDDGADIQPETSEEALLFLEYYMAAENYDVIIVDVLTGFLPDEQFKQNVYRGDYKELKPYHVLALKYHALILGTWHSVKRETNPRYMYNGSSGLWAVPASRITLYTDQEQRVRIFSMPRFCPKSDWALTQEQTIQGRRWVVSDAAPEPVMGDQERAIFRWLRDNSDKSNPKTPSTIAEMVGLQANTVRTILGRMFDKNLVQRGVGNGYFIDVALVADVAPVAHVADVALVKDGISATDVAPMLRNGSLSDAEKTSATNATSIPRNGSATSGVPSDYAPSPASQEMIGRLKARSKEQ